MRDQLFPRQPNLSRMNALVDMVQAGARGRVVQKGDGFSQRNAIVGNVLKEILGWLSVERGECLPAQISPCALPKAADRRINGC